MSVEPIENEAALRNRDWVEGNLKKVERRHRRAVAYVYVPNTAEPGYTYFKRYFYPQAHKDAVIVDERFNGGGQIADYYIDILRRPLISYWATRYGDDLRDARGRDPRAEGDDHRRDRGLRRRPAAVDVPQVPASARSSASGPGAAWSASSGSRSLMDGGTITAPNFAIWTPEDGWVVENEGVPPDIEVEQTPKDVIAGPRPAARARHRGGARRAQEDAGGQAGTAGVSP